MQEHLEQPGSEIPLRGGAFISAKELVNLFRKSDIATAERAATADGTGGDVMGGTAGTQNGIFNGVWARVKGMGMVADQVALEIIAKEGKMQVVQDLIERCGHAHAFTF